MRQSFKRYCAMILPKLKQMIPPIISKAAIARRSHNFPEAEFSMTSKPSRQTSTPKTTENIPRLDWMTLPKTGPMMPKQMSKVICDPSHSSENGSEWHCILRFHPVLNNAGSEQIPNTV